MVLTILIILFSSNSIINSSEEAISTSKPFNPNLSLDGETEYESILWTKHSGPGDIIFSDPTILNPEISATESGFYEAKITVTYPDGSIETELVPFEWVEVDSKPPEAFSITSPTASEITPTSFDITWTKANDESPVKYEIKILDASCSTEVLRDEVDGVLSYNVATGNLSPATNYCLKLKATDSNSFYTEASNNPYLLYNRRCEHHYINF